MDHRGQWGIGAALGGALAAPWAQRPFSNSVGAGPSGSAWARYVPGTPEIGVEISYNYFQLSKMQMKTHAAIMSFFSRQNPWGSFHPFYAFGVGYQSTTGFYTTGDWETPIIKFTAGIEFELSERTDFGIYLNHYTIFKNKTAEADAHVLAPALSLTYYFGEPEPLPPAASPAVTPAPAPSATAAPVAKPKAEPTPFDDLDPAPAKKPAPKQIKRPAPKPAKKAVKKPAPKKRR